MVQHIHEANTVSILIQSSAEMNACQKYKVDILLHLAAEIELTHFNGARN